MIAQGSLGLCFWKPKIKLLMFFANFPRWFKMKKGLNIVSIISDHGGEFQNDYFEKICEENVIHHNFSALITP